MMKRIAGALAALVLAGCATTGTAQSCDKACLEGVADAYRAAYLAHDVKKAPFAANVRYSENNVLMPFPDGTWDTVTETPGPVLTLSDPKTQQAAIYMPIRQRAIEGFLAVRLKVAGGKITEAEHIISTARNLSSPPTPIAPIAQFSFDPIIEKTVPAGERVSRDKLIAHANGYFDTLQHNNGEIRGTCFKPDATRRENMMLFNDILGGFKSGRYAFNDRVRREIFFVDEARQVALGRGFIDHKGVMDDIRLTDGTTMKSVYQEPQSWGFLEMFKVEDDCIAAVIAAFFQAPYYQATPWHPEGQR